MASNAEVGLQNILFTFRRYADRKAELLYLSSEIRNLHVNVTRFYNQEFFEKILPTLARPIFDTLFEVLGQGEKFQTYLVTDPDEFQEVKIEGYNLSQEDGSYLVHVLISPQPKNPEINLRWLVRHEEKSSYSCHQNQLHQNLNSLVAISAHLARKFSFLDGKELTHFIEEPDEGKFTVYEDYIFLEKKALENGYLLVQLIYESNQEERVTFFNEDKEHLIRANSGVIYYEHGVGEQQIHWSGAIWQILGYSLSDFKKIGILDWGELIHPEDLPNLYTGFENDFSAEHTLQSVYRMRHKKGHYVYVQDTARTYFNENTGKHLVIGMIKDISLMKEIEADLFDNRFKLKQLTSVVPGMVFMLKAKPDRKHQFIFVSEGVRQLFGISPQNFIKKFPSFLDLVHSEDREMLLEADRKAYEQDTKFEVYFRVNMPDGSLKWIYGASNRLKKYSNDSIWSGFFIDVTYTKLKEEEARLNFQRYKSIFDNNPLAIMHLETDMRIVSVNRTFIRMFGVEDDSAIIGRKIHDFGLDEAVLSALGDAERYGTGLYEGPYNSYFINAAFYLKIVVKKLDGEKGYQVIIEDMTEKEFTRHVLNQIAEISARYSDKNFFDEVVKLLSAKLNFQVCLIGEYLPKTQSIQTLSVAINGQLSSNFEYALKNTPCETSLAAKGEVTLVADKVAEKFPEDTMLQELGIESYCAIAIRDKNGKKIGLLALLDKHPIHNENSLRNIMAILGDRTGAELQRLNYEKELLESEQLYRSIAENFPKGTVHVLDLQYRYIYTEGKEYEKMDLDPASLVGQYHLEKYSEPVAQKAKSHLDRVLLGETVTYEISFGDQYYLKIGVPLRNKEQEIERILLVSQNITEAKKSGEERERLIQDLKSHNEELQRFAYIVSHNLRAPIVNISALLELFNMADIGDPANEEVVDNLKVSTSILNATLMDLIEVVSIRKQKLPKIENVVFSQLLNNLEKSLNKQLKEANANVHKDFTELKSINYVYAHLENFLLNFLTNAIKYKHPHRNLEVWIKTYSEGEYGVISFSDNGIGIDLDRYGDRLFGLYQRFHSHIEGKGLGLYLVREQIRAHDGKIEIDSQVDSGTSFRVYLKNMQLSSLQNTVRTTYSEE